METSQMRQTPFNHRPNNQPHYSIDYSSAPKRKHTKTHYIDEFYPYNDRYQYEEYETYPENDQYSEDFEYNSNHSEILTENTNFREPASTQIEDTSQNLQEIETNNQN